MEKLPIVICSSVVRSSQIGESHGGLYLIDLESEEHKQVVDWDDPSINWEGRGSDRGLRGIAYYQNEIICAASDEIFFYDTNFNIVNSYKNKYLKHCHEIFVENDSLYLTSTGFDSILKFDLINKKFVRGYCWRKIKPFKGPVKSKMKRAVNKVLQSFEHLVFDPQLDNGPAQADTTHINNVFLKDENIYFSGTGLASLISITQGENFKKVMRIPTGTHNVQFHNQHILYNNTKGDNVVYRDLSRGKILEFEILKYKMEELSNCNLPVDFARQGFGRGLCVHKNLLIGGSSPSTISVYDTQSKKRIKAINLSKDIRNSVHGLEIYPFDYE